MRRLGVNIIISLRIILFSLYEKIKPIKSLDGVWEPFYCRTSISSRAPPSEWMKFLIFRLTNLEHGLSYKLGFMMITWFMTSRGRFFNFVILVIFETYPIFRPILRPHMVYSRVFLLEPEVITDLNYDLARKKLKKNHSRKNGVRKQIRNFDF